MPTLSSQGLRLSPSRLLIVGGLVALLLMLGNLSSINLLQVWPFSAVTAEITSTSRPNFVVIMVDDMSYQHLDHMKKTRQLMAGQGTTFTNFIISHPLCCPSRATLMTGQYDQNNQVRSNGKPDGGFSVFRATDQSTTLASALSRSGYSTTLIGKYLNGTPATAGKQPGWTNWHSFVVNGRKNDYYNYYINHNGKRTLYGSRKKDYLTDVLRNRAVTAIKNQSARNRPFFLLFTPWAPHSSRDGTATPAPRHRGLGAGMPVPQSPAYMEADVSDKPHIIASMPITDRTRHGKLITRTYRRECEALKSVDEAVSKIVRAVREAGEINNTYFIFMSDNGFAHGEHRITFGKDWPYEEIIRVPMIIRGPGIAKKATSDKLVSNVDIAATILDLARVNKNYSRLQDGISLTNFLNNPNYTNSRAILIQGQWDADTQSYGWEGVRTDRYVYIRWSTDEQELYDLKTDPYQLQSLHASSNHQNLLNKLRTHLNKLRNCKGQECSQPVVY